MIGRQKKFELTFVHKVSVTKGAIIRRAIKKQLFQKSKFAKVFGSNLFQLEQKLQLVLAVENTQNYLN